MYSFIPGGFPSERNTCLARDPSIAPVSLMPPGSTVPAGGPHASRKTC